MKLFQVQSPLELTPDDIELFKILSSINHKSGYTWDLSSFFKDETAVAYYIKYRDYINEAFVMWSDRQQGVFDTIIIIPHPPRNSNLGDGSNLAYDEFLHLFNNCKNDYIQSCLGEILLPVNLYNLTNRRKHRYDIAKWISNYYANFDFKSKTDTPYLIKLKFSFLARALETSTSYNLDDKSFITQSVIAKALLYLETCLSRAEESKAEADIHMLYICLKALDGLSNKSKFKKSAIDFKEQLTSARGRLLKIGDFICDRGLKSDNDKRYCLYLVDLIGCKNNAYFKNAHLMEYSLIMQELTSSPCLSFDFIFRIIDISNSLRNADSNLFKEETDVLKNLLMNIRDIPAFGHIFQNAEIKSLLNWNPFTLDLLFIGIQSRFSDLASFMESNNKIIIGLVEEVNRLVSCPSSSDTGGGQVIFDGSSLSSVADSTSYIIEGFSNLMSDSFEESLISASQLINLYSVCLAYNFDQLSIAMYFRDLVYNSNLVSEYHKPNLVRAFIAFNNSDYYLFIAIAIPIFEDVCRNMFRELKGDPSSTCDITNKGTLVQKTLGQVLESLSLFQSSIRNTAILSYYLMVVRARFGNLRNEYCHGLKIPIPLENHPGVPVFWALFIIICEESKGNSSVLNSSLLC